MATTPKDLRSGRSIWQKGRAAVSFQKELNRSLRTDVLIVGAGITGAMIADSLVSAGLKVVVVDKRGPAQGSTLASTALVLYEIDTPLTSLVRKIGKESAIRAWRRSRLAVEKLAARFDDLGVPEVARRNSLYLSGNGLDSRGLWREHEARLTAGLPSRFLARGTLKEKFGIARSAALLGHGNLVIDPRKATLALLTAAAEDGARIVPRIEVTEVKPGKRSTEAILSNGRRIRCDYLVFATGYELPQYVPRRNHKITTTWAIATVRQNQEALWPTQCCIWEASDPYLYIRTAPDGRVICGGGDEPFSGERRRDALLKRKSATLRRKLHDLLPRLDTTVEYAWAGTFGETRSGLPIISEIPDMPRCWIALGYGGNGTTYAAIAADVITGAITGRGDVDGDLYRFDHR